MQIFFFFLFFQELDTTCQDIRVFQMLNFMGFFFFFFFFTNKILKTTFTFMSYHKSKAKTPSQNFYQKPLLVLFFFFFLSKILLYVDLLGIIWTNRL
jgi:hypothetical protein